MKKHALGVAALALVAMGFSIGCGPSQQDLDNRERARIETAKNNALQAFEEIRFPMTSGERAMTLSTRIETSLHDGELGYEAIGSSPGEIDGYVRGAYAEDVSRGLAGLRATYANAATARMMKANILKNLEASGRSLASFDTSEARLDESIQRNLLEEVRATGRPVSPAMYRAAGLPPHRVIVVKRVLVPVRSKRPVTKLARR